MKNLILILLIVYLSFLISHCVNAQCVVSTAPTAINTNNNPICVDSATTLSISDGVLGTGATWKWYSGKCGGTFVDSAKTSIRVSSATTTTYYVRGEGSCGNSACDSIVIIVNAKVSIIFNPSSAAVLPGNITSFEITATGTGLSFQWQYYTTGTWQNVPTGSPYSGQNDTLLVINPVILNMNDYKYRCIVSDICNDKVTSASATLTILMCGCGPGWEGTISSDWDTDGNWDTGIKPDANTDVYITASAIHQPVITGSAVCHSITIYPNASLTVNGTLNCEGNLLIKSDATGSGAFTQSDSASVNITGTVTVQKYIPSLGYQYISSPVTGVQCNQISGFTMTNTTGNTWYDPNKPTLPSPWPNMWRIDENHTHFVCQSDYNSWWAPKSTEIILPTVGYSTNFSNVSTLSVTKPGSNLNAGDYTATISKELVSTDVQHNNMCLDEAGIINGNYQNMGCQQSGTGPANGVHLIGNPYPSPIDWDTVEAQGGITGEISHTIFLYKPTWLYTGIYGYYNPTFGSFGAFNPTKNIPAMTSFFILNCDTGKANNYDNFTFKNSYRTVTSKALQPLSYSNPITKNIQFPFVGLTISINAFPNEADETVILFTPDAKAKFDTRYDMYKDMNIDPNYSNIYTVNSGKDFASKALPAITDSLKIKLGINNNTSGTTKINATEILNMPKGSHVFLEDTKLQSVQDLNVNPIYQFSESSGEDTGRFVLLFTKLPDIQGQITYDNIANTPLGGVSVSLLNNESQIIAQTQSDNSGHYKLSDIPGGAYTIEANYDTTFTGINPLQALLVNKHYIKLYNFTDALMQEAADVNNDNKINPIDALLINRYYLKLVTSFKAGKWIFESPSVNVGEQNVTSNFKGICVGDVNGSCYKP